jgi:predicted nucleotidyltransferase component of viral defense system
MPDEFYQNSLYPLQNDVLKLVEDAKLDFYLTGGTALSRCYIHHRYSDDIDLFVNENPGFKNQAEKIVYILKKQDWHVVVTTTADSFVRIMLERNKIDLKIDIVNDVPFHYGEFEKASFFSKIDNWRNILSNKICALSRLESKDIADILFISKKYQFDWEDIFNEAKEKDIWVEPLSISKLIDEFPAQKLSTIKWINPIDMDIFSK